MPLVLSAKVAPDAHERDRPMPRLPQRKRNEDRNLAAVLLEVPAAHALGPFCLFHSGEAFGLLRCEVKWKSGSFACPVVWGGDAEGQMPIL